MTQMKFIRAVDGRLVSSDEWELQNAINDLDARLESRLEDLGSEGRASLVARLRQRWTDIGTTLSSEDEEVLSLFCDRTLEFRHLQGHFGSRLVEAWLF
jgi:hypothetical protein